MNAIRTTTLRPGLLVSMHTSVTGNVRYSKETIEAERLESDGKKRAKWNTEKVVHDPGEFDEASEIRSSARYMVKRICSVTEFGMLCPEDKAEELAKAVAEARAKADEFNKRAKITRISVYVITGRIAPDDVEAVRAINSEVRGLMEAMAAGVANLDVKAIREAADKAKSIGQMLTPDAQARIQVAVDLARDAAKRIRKAGEQAAQEVDKVAISRLTEARTAFLDLDDAGEVAVPEADARAVDFEPVDVAPVQAPAAPAFELEF